MNFTISKNDFYKSLQKVIGVIPSKTTIPILENVLLELKEEKLHLTGTDLEICVSTEIKVNGVQTGTCTVPAKALNDILRELPDVPIEITLDGNNMLHLKTEKGLYKLVAQPKDEFPSIVVEESEGKLEMESSSLSRLIDKTIFAVSSDELRPTLMGVYFQLLEDELRCVATDGHRLVKLSNRNYKSEEFQKSVIVPTKALSLVHKNIDSLPNKDEKMVSFSVGENHVIFRMYDTFIYSKIIEGNYPKYENVIPMNNDKKLVVNRDDLAASVKRVAIFSNLLTHQIKFHVEDNRMVVSSEDIEFGGEGSEEIAVKFDHESMEIGYNAMYILDVLRHLDTDEVHIKLSDAVSAAIVYPSTQQENEDLMMLIMPIRLNEQ
ncbi:MAG: DNA polymerase III subunit beta [candidate division KSB1 bacterium]|jgi:DNA polymerase-3 subunit beta|nr:DNA polymerase III subunit beta [candidate division KSB1 bacterium]